MAKAIMVQGTMSNAGKSFLVAGLCRIFRQDGYRVAPFKSQNMALNSFITTEGLEMGRAQVMQAEAAGVEPSVRMNPILLKPTNDTGSQVIVNGVPIGNMDAAVYYQYKRKLVKPIMEAYDSLAAENDILVLEGAGSPAEINLKQEDIVNMGMAKLAHAPVLLAGDIDRGGVFASLYGTMALLEESERAMVKGMVINKFRGDAELLKPGLRMLEERTHVPFVGVVPYLPIELDDEDSLSERLSGRPKEGLLDLVVIRWPKVSNFTDFNPLARIPGVTLRYVDRPECFGEPDLVLLPGTKNVMGDLAWMRNNGLENCVRQYASQGGPVLGICGGYQMLGMTIRDPEQVEGGGSMQGMGLLPVDTVYVREKVRTRVRGTVLPVGGLLRELSGVPFVGYEIHMGRTTRREGTAPFAVLQELGGAEKEDGAVCGNVYGTYAHGFFDAEPASALARILLRKKGFDGDAIQSVDAHAFKEQQYNQLADALRTHLDLKKIYAILEQGLSEGGEADV